MIQKVLIRFFINDNLIITNIKPNELLITTLRKHSFFSIKEGDANGTSGSSIVLLTSNTDKLIPIQANFVLTATMNDKRITTLEGFSNIKDFLDIKEGFEKAGVSLCGFCDSGKYLVTYSIITTINRPHKDNIYDIIKDFTCPCVDKDTLINGIIFAASIRNRRLKEK